MDTNDSGDIDLPEFLLLMAKRMADSNIEEDITEAFKVFYTIRYSSITIICYPAVVLYLFGSVDT